MTTTAVNSASRKLGELLVDRHLVSKDVLERLLVQEAETGVPLARLLVDDGHVQEADLLRTIAARINMEFLELDNAYFDPEAVQKLSSSDARALGAIPMRVEGNRLVVAVADPFDPEKHRRLEQLTSMPVHLVLATRATITEAIDKSIGAAGGHAAMSVAAAPGDPDHEEFHVNQLLAELMDMSGSDLHLTAGSPPQVRVHGDLKALEQYGPMKPATLRRLLYGILTEKQREKLEETLELDGSHPVPRKGRFRVNVFFQRDSIGAVFRAIPSEIKGLEELGLPPAVAGFADLKRGMVLVTGPTGSGKSTTLASIIDLVNQRRAGHIMTVEDPIEFLHRHKRCIVNQREVGADTMGFGDALKHVLRQDPDVILVGELRDLETISTALTAAETGHLVFATLHTQDAPQTIDRVIDVFPPHQQQQVRVQLAATLQAIVTQQLVPTADGRGRAVAAEVMVATPAIRNLIREAKNHQITTAMQAGGRHGMVTMDQSLAELVRRNKITFETGAERCANLEDYQRMAGRG
jgi:twitching motility protein PilT